MVNEQGEALMLKSGQMNLSLLLDASFRAA